MGLEQILEVSKISKNRVLDLSYQNLSEVPECLKDFTWIKILRIKGNNIKELKNLPPNLSGLDASYNKMKKIDGINLEQKITSFNVSHNKLEYVKYLPDTIAYLRLEENKLINIDSFPQNCILINIAENSLTSLPELPHLVNRLDCRSNLLTYEGVDGCFNEKLKSINMSGNKFTKLPIFFDDVVNIEAGDNYINKIEYLPKNLKKIELYNNNLKQIDLNDGLHIVDLSHNGFSHCPIFPEGIIEINISDNELTELTNIPISVKKLDISRNYLHDIEFDLMSRLNMELKYGDNYIESENEMSLFNDCSTKSNSSDENIKIFNDYQNVNLANFSEEEKEENNILNINNIWDHRSFHHNSGYRNYHNNHQHAYTNRYHNYYTNKYRGYNYGNQTITSLFNNPRASKSNPHYIIPKGEVTV